MDWETLILAQQEGKINDIGRSDAVAKRYEDFKKRVKEKFSSVEDHILINVFDMPAEWINSKMQRALCKPDPEAIKFTLNRFPYHVEAHHFVIWFGSSQAQKNFISTADLRKYLPRNLRYQPFFYHINTPEFKTIPGIEHVHLFVKKRTGGKNVSSR